MAVGLCHINNHRGPEYHTSSRRAETYRSIPIRFQVVKLTRWTEPCHQQMHSNVVVQKGRNKPQW